MDMSNMTSMVMSATTTSTAATTTTTSYDFAPGSFDPKGRYIPTGDEMMEYQSTREPWEWNVVYGYYTLAVLSGILISFSFTHALWQLRLRYKTAFNQARSWHVPVAILRLLSYPQLPYSPSLIWIWAFGPLGPNLVLFAGLLFATLITWVNKYYYRLPFYGSAPLCLRAEWIAMASLPFIFALGPKRNFISLLTGVSHERLQIFHQGLAFNFVYMSLVHALACIHSMYREEGFLYAFGMYPLLYTSGFVALAAFLVSFVGALPVFRKLFYETFWFVHVVVALLGIAALFWHGYKTLDSDAYMIATIVLFLSSVLWRLVMVAFHNPTTHVATIGRYSEDAIKITIPTHTIRWSPGQHIFLRFLGISPLEAHPFTIASIDEAVRVKNGVEIREMEFLVRPQRGFTKKLADMTPGAGTVTYGVLVDGPYGAGGRDLHAFEEILILIGGSGITWGVAILKDLVSNGGVAGRRVERINFVWCVRNAEAIEWFRKELEKAIRLGSSTLSVTITIYVTDGRRLGSIHRISSQLSTLTSSLASPSSREKTSCDPEKDGAAAMDIIGAGIIVRYERPELKTIVSTFAEQAKGSIGVACCGPQGFSAEICNAVSRVQLLIIRGQLPDVKEAYLKSESYEW